MYLRSPLCVRSLYRHCASEVWLPNSRAVGQRGVVYQVIYLDLLYADVLRTGTCIVLVRSVCPNPTKVPACTHAHASNEFPGPADTMVTVQGVRWLSRGRFAFQPTLRECHKLTRARRPKWMAVTYTLNTHTRNTPATHTHTHTHTNASTHMHTLSNTTQAHARCG